MKLPPIVVALFSMIWLISLFGPAGCTQDTGMTRGSASASTDARVVSTESLLAEMVDLCRLTRLASPCYTTKQFSSYDRAAKSPAENWFANGDAANYLRVEDNQGRQEHVMVDADGPGAVVRIWSANPQGTLRVYLDGNATPVIEADMKELLGGKVAGFPVPLAGERSRGWNLYFPIAYAKHCRVTSDSGKFYYHVNYRTYAPGTRLESFAPTDLERCADKIAQVAEKLASPRDACRPPAHCHVTRFAKTVADGDTCTLSEIRGSKVIREFLVRLEADDLAVAARGVILEVTFDGQKTVETPIGDFFGTAPGLIPYESLPVGITEHQPQTLWSHWPMPFSQRATIAVRNLSGREVRVTGTVSTLRYQWDDSSLLFHAKWRIERDIPTRPMTDWTHLQCTGQGRFVGGALHLVNPAKIWWGEGDEKIYVDGETFPSHFGTGTEDYYGYAWGCPDRFVHAYHNQPNCDGPGTYGNISNGRFHIIDDIPFTRSFKFDMENWHWDDTVKTTRAGINYWYARPGGSDFFAPITRQDARLLVVPPYKKMKVPGALEGEEMAIIHKTGKVGVRELDRRCWSNDAILTWSEAKVGDKLALGFSVEVQTNSHVIARPVVDRRYGKVQFYINGIKAGDVVDLFSDKGLNPAAEIDLGTFDLQKGLNQLTIEIVSAGKKPTEPCSCGLDYIRLE